MTHNADDTANKHFTIANKLKEKASRNQVLTAPLPDPITKNIEAISSLQNQEVRDIPAHQRLLEAIATFFGRSTFLYSLLVILAIWIFGSFFERFLPFNLPRLAGQVKA